MYFPPSYIKHCGCKQREYESMKIASKNGLVKETLLHSLTHAIVRANNSKNQTRKKDLFLRDILQTHVGLNCDLANAICVFFFDDEYITGAAIRRAFFHQYADYTSSLHEKIQRLQHDQLMHKIFSEKTHLGEHSWRCPCKICEYRQQSIQCDPILRDLSAEKVQEVQYILEFQNLHIFDFQ